MASFASKKDPADNSAFSKDCPMARPRVAALLLLIVASFARGAVAVGQGSTSRTQQSILAQGAVFDEGDGGDHQRKPLLRQEHALNTAAAETLSGSLEVSPTGGFRSRVDTSGGNAGLAEQSKSRLGQGRHGRRNPDSSLNHTEVAMPEESKDFDLRCVNYPRDLSNDAADPISTGEYMCAGNTCKKEEYIAAGDRCCNCDGGAQFRAYANTQCIGGSGLSDVSGDRSNPQDYSDVNECMEACWALGENCTAISVINSDSDYAGKCYFRKGALKYIHDYKECYNSTCEQRNVEDTITMTTTQEPDNETRLPFCEDDNAFENTPCTKDPREARPKTHTTTTPPDPNPQDGVVDDRDCFVKYLWWR